MISHSHYTVPVNLGAIASNSEVFARLDAEPFQTCLSDAIALLSSPARP
jgi:hypothetical protein